MRCLTKWIQAASLRCQIAQPPPSKRTLLVPSADASDPRVYCVCRCTCTFSFAFAYELLRLRTVDGSLTARTYSLDLHARQEKNARVCVPTLSRSLGSRTWQRNYVVTALPHKLRAQKKTPLYHINYAQNKKHRGTRDLASPRYQRSSVKQGCSALELQVYITWYQEYITVLLRFF